MSMIRRRSAAALITCAALGALPMAAHAEYDPSLAPSLSRGEAREAAEDALLDRVGDAGEIRSIRCYRMRRAAAKCEARGTLDAANPADGSLRWKAKVFVAAELDDLGDEVVTATIKHFQVGAVLTRQRAADAASARLLAALEADATIDETYCRLTSANEARCVLTGSTVDVETGQEEQFEAKVRVKAVASTDGTVRIGTRITGFVAWPVFDADETEYDGGGYGGWMPPRY